VRKGTELGDKTDQYLAAVAILNALSRTHPREEEEKKITPRTLIYPIEASEFMGLVKTGQHMLPRDYEHLGAAVAQECEIGASRANDTDLVFLNRIPTHLRESFGLFHRDLVCHSGALLLPPHPRA
jgi:hypothetical protein